MTTLITYDTIFKQRIVQLVRNQKNGKHLTFMQIDFKAIFNDDNTDFNKWKAFITKRLDATSLTIDNITIYDLLDVTWTHWFDNKYIAEMDFTLPFYKCFENCIFVSPGGNKELLKNNSYLLFLYIYLFVIYSIYYYKLYSKIKGLTNLLNFIVNNVPISTIEISSKSFSTLSPSLDDIRKFLINYCASRSMIAIYKEMDPVLKAITDDNLILTNNGHMVSIKDQMVALTDLTEYNKTVSNSIKTQFEIVQSYMIQFLGADTPYEKIINMLKHEGTQSDFYKITGLIKKTDKMRDIFEHITPTAQCTGTIGGCVPSTNPNGTPNTAQCQCYICGYPIENKWSSPECEHVFPVLQACIHLCLLLYNDKKVSPDPNIGLEYFWAHKCCNQLKSDLYQFIERVPKTSPLTGYEYRFKRDGNNGCNDFFDKIAKAYENNNAPKQICYEFFHIENPDGSITPNDERINFFTNPTAPDTLAKNKKIFCDGLEARLQNLIRYLNESGNCEMGTCPDSNNSLLWNFLMYRVLQYPTYNLLIDLTNTNIISGAVSIKTEKLCKQLFSEGLTTKAFDILKIANLDFNALSTMTTTALAEYTALDDDNQKKYNTKLVYSLLKAAVFYYLGDCYITTKKGISIFCPVTSSKSNFEYNNMFVLSLSELKFDAITEILTPGGTPAGTPIAYSINHNIIFLINNYELILELLKDAISKYPGCFKYLPPPPSGRAPRIQPVTIEESFAYYKTNIDDFLNKLRILRYQITAKKSYYDVFAEGDNTQIIGKSVFYTYTAKVADNDEMRKKVKMFRIVIEALQCFFIMAMNQFVNFGDTADNKYEKINMTDLISSLSKKYGGYFEMAGDDVSDTNVKEVNKKEDEGERSILLTSIDYSIIPYEPSTIPTNKSKSNIWEIVFLNTTEQLTDLGLLEKMEAKILSVLPNGGVTTGGGKNSKQKILYGGTINAENYTTNQEVINNNNYIKNYPILERENNKFIEEQIKYFIDEYGNSNIDHNTMIVQNEVEDEEYDEFAGISLPLPNYEIPLPLPTQMEQDIVDEENDEENDEDNADVMGENIVEDIGENNPVYQKFQGQALQKTRKNMKEFVQGKKAQKTQKIRDEIQKKTKQERQERQQMIQEQQRQQMIEEQQRQRMIEEEQQRQRMIEEQQRQQMIDEQQRINQQQRVNRKQMNEIEEPQSEIHNIKREQVERTIQDRREREEEAKIQQRQERLLQEAERQAEAERLLQEAQEAREEQDRQAEMQMRIDQERQLQERQWQLNQLNGNINITGDKKEYGIRSKRLPGEQYQFNTKRARRGEGAGAGGGHSKKRLNKKRKNKKHTIKKRKHRKNKRTLRNK